MDAPSPALANALRELRLADEKILRKAARHCRRLAVDLPTFDSIWLDALVRMRKLTPFQARALQDHERAFLRIGDYLLVDRLRRGPCGVAYLARRLTDHRAVVVDHISVPNERRTAAIESLRSLIDAAKELRSPHIAVPEELIVDGDRVAIISRFVPGRDGRASLIRHGRLEPSFVVHVGRQLLSGLEQAHRLGLAHGDIRIENIRISASGDATLVDFGIREALSPGNSIQEHLPPEWLVGMAPERIGRIATATTSSDVYSLGCVLWQLLAGRPPFAVGDSLSLLTAHRFRRLLDVLDVAPETPPSIAEAIKGMTAQDPSDRLTNVAELQRVFATSSVSRRLRRDTRSRAKAFPWISAAAVLFALSGTALYLSDRDATTVLLAAGSRSEPAVDTAAISENPDHGLLPLPAPDARGVINLESSGPYAVADVAFRGSLVLQGSADYPATLVVEDQPLHLWADDVTLEHVRFVHSSPRPAFGSMVLALVESQHLTVRNCRFETAAAISEDATAFPSAIAWRLVDAADPTAGRVLISNSVFRCVRRGIQFESVPRRSTVANVLGIACDALLGLRTTTTSTELSLESVTLRQCRSVITAGGDEREGALSVVAHDSIFDLTPRGALVADQSNSATLTLNWRGSGVVISQSTQVLSRGSSPSDVQKGTPPSANVEGVAVGRIEFAGPAGGPDAASFARASGVPRQAGRPLGADFARLPKVDTELILRQGGADGSQPKIKNAAR